MNPDSCTHGTYRETRDSAVFAERSRAARVLSRLANEHAGNPEYLQALDDIAAAIPLTRTVAVTYSATVT